MKDTTFIMTDNICSSKAWLKIIYFKDIGPNDLFNATCSNDIYSITFYAICFNAICSIGPFIITAFIPIIFVVMKSVLIRFCLLSFFLKTLAKTLAQARLFY
jgi:hypothetical protein